MEERLRRVLGLNFGATLSGNFSPDLIPSAGKRAYAAAVLLIMSVANLYPL